MSDGRSDQAPVDPWAKTAERLERVFGTGEDPTLRRELYRRIEQACQAYGMSAYRIVGQCFAISRRKKYPDRYFCRIVVQRLAEAGFYDHGAEGGF